jgi:outer membrane protein
MRARHHVFGVVVAGLCLTAAPALAQAPAPPRPAPAAAPLAPAASVVRVGFVDVQRVLARSAGGVSAREQLEREKAMMQKEVDAKRQELEQLRDELEKKGALMTADARRDKQDQFERKRRDAARLADDYQKELEKKEQGLLQRVLSDLSGVIERVAKDKGFALVVERRGLLYAAAEADLTDEIIRVYDQGAGAKGGNDASKGTKK